MLDERYNDVISYTAISSFARAAEGALKKRATVTGLFEERQRKVIFNFLQLLAEGDVILQLVPIRMRSAWNGAVEPGNTTKRVSLFDFFTRCGLTFEEKGFRVFAFAA